jgi:uncharacterized protein
VLYLDSSALSKRYLKETGWQELAHKVQETTSKKQRVLTSVVTYAELHAALGRKLRDGSMLPAEHHWATTYFEADWRTYLSLIEVSQAVLSFIPDLVKRHPMKGSDATHLASAIWAADSLQRRGSRSLGRSSLLFATSDRQLVAAAKTERLEVFNPEKPPAP